jgi:lipid II:glycine glycyltransferase (peptidoglycan interpeptide bridge formation enzyme)
MKIVRDENQLPLKLPVEASKVYLSMYNPIDCGWFVSDKFIIPFLIEKKIIFKRLTFTSVPLRYNEGKETEKEFLDSVIATVKKMSVHFIGQSPAFVIFPFIPQGAKGCIFGTLQIDLNLSLDELWDRVHSKHRNVIKRAMNDQLTVSSGENYLMECAELIKETMLRQGKDFVSKETLVNYLSSLQDEVRFYVVKKDTEVQGCAVIAWRKDYRALYLYGGSISKPSTGALNFLHWNIIQNMKAEGVRIYDLVGARIKPEENSKYEGIQRFKERMGAELITGYIWKLPINSFMYSLYSFISILKNFKHQKKFVGDVIDEESKRFKKINFNL